MTAGKPILQVYAIAPTTVVGFGGRDVLDDINVAACREELYALLDANPCDVIAFDLTGVSLVPSGLLGVLTSLLQRGQQVHLYNPSADVREVLSVTNLDRLMPIHEVAIERPVAP